MFSSLLYFHYSHSCNYLYFYPYLMRFCYFSVSLCGGYFCILAVRDLAKLEKPQFLSKTWTPIRPTLEWSSCSCKHFPLSRGRCIKVNHFRVGLVIFLNNFKDITKQSCFFFTLKCFGVRFTLKYFTWTF